MRKLALLPLLLLVSLDAAAARECLHEAPRNLDLDLTGVERVVIDLGSHELVLRGGDGGGQVRGRACSTDPDLLDHLDIEQSRDGSTLVLRASHVADKHQVMVLFGSHYEYLSLLVDLPRTLAVELRVGSGDARVEGLAGLGLTIGSGDVQIPSLQGALEVTIGSGDLVAERIGALRLRSLGSGDATIAHVGGDAEIGSVGSGDLTLKQVDGNVGIDSIGSGDVALRAVAGNVTLRSIGSGDLSVRDAGGDLTVQRKGSGDISHSGVKGSVSLPKRD